MRQGFLRNHRVGELMIQSTVHGMIFDCDGVLIDSRNANITYYNSLLSVVGRPPMTPAQEEYVHMASEQQAIEHILTPEEVERYDDIAAHVPYGQVVLPLLELQPGAEEVLLWLKSRGIRLALHTNRSAGVWHVLDKFSFRHMFDPVMSVDKVAPKPSPEGVLRVLDAWKLAPRQVVFVGDSLVDALAAAGGGVPFVSFGTPDLPHAVACVRSFWQLRSWFLEQPAESADGGITSG